MLCLRSAAYIRLWFMYLLLPHTFPGIARTAEPARLSASGSSSSLRGVLLCELAILVHARTCAETQTDAVGAPHSYRQGYKHA